MFKIPGLPFKARPTKQSEAALRRRQERDRVARRNPNPDPRNPRGYADD